MQRAGVGGGQLFCAWNERITKSTHWQPPEKSGPSMSTFGPQKGGTRNLEGGLALLRARGRTLRQPASRNRIKHHKSCPLGLRGTSTLCTASHVIFRFWGSREPGFPSGIEGVLPKRGPFFRARTSGFAAAGTLKTKNNMRSGAKGGGWRWTTFLRME